jgi:ribulose-phosphate 3-epimerase
LRRIREAGAVAGLALNPGTPVEAIEPALSECDVVLVMSVEPGFGGQKFIPSALDKLRRLARQIEPPALLSVDGGIGPDTIAEAARAGASVFVAGSAIFDSGDYGKAIEEMARIAGDHLVSSTIEN